MKNGKRRGDGVKRHTYLCAVGWYEIADLSAAGTQ